MAGPQDVLFISLVQQFRVTALIGLGKMENPLSKKTGRNLEQAKYAIDVLGMLAAKTAGNTTAEEAGMLKDTLSRLQMAYVEERSRT